MPQKFRFLCGNFGRFAFIYGVKFNQHPWHYFDQVDTLASEHDSLPAELENFIMALTAVKTIEIVLDDEQANNYFKDGRFIFKNKELKTYMSISGITPATSTENHPTKRKMKTTKELTFLPDETNPLLFLAEFEKCLDVKSDGDKTYKIRHFVNDEHRPEFSQLNFTADWPTVKSMFLKKYCLKFIENKKKELDIKFEEEPNLRSFVSRKLSSFAKYTTLPVINQMELILNDLPNDISHLFMVNEKFDCDKNEILDFCDSIEEVVSKYNEDRNTVEDANDVIINEPLNRMEVFNFDPDALSETDSELTLVEEPQEQPTTSTRRVSNRKKNPIAKRKVVKKGGPSKKKKQQPRPIPTDIDTGGYDFLNVVSDTSRSSWSSKN